MTGGFGFVDPPLIGTDLIEFDDLPGTDLVLLPVALEDELVLLELVLLLEEDLDDEDLEADERELDFDFDGAFATAVL